MVLNFLKENTGFLVRIDDVTENMNWEMMNRCEKLFDKYNIRPLLGVIPFNKDKELLKFKKKDNFWSKVLECQNKGWEISMHGCEHKYSIDTHKKDYFSYGGMSEFFNLPYNMQKEKIIDGLNLFKKKKYKCKIIFCP
jgi:predicted deacetylase